MLPDIPFLLASLFFTKLKSFFKALAFFTILRKRYHIYEFEKRDPQPITKKNEGDEKKVGKVKIRAEIIGRGIHSCNEPLVIAM